MVAKFYHDAIIQGFISPRPGAGVAARNVTLRETREAGSGGAT